MKKEGKREIAEITEQIFKKIPIKAVKSASFN